MGVEALEKLDSLYHSWEPTQDCGVPYTVLVRTTLLLMEGFLLLVDLPLPAA